MKRKFLQNIKVGDQVLPREIIDAILDERSRSIGTVRTIQLAVEKVGL